MKRLMSVSFLMLGLAAVAAPGEESGQVADAMVAAPVRTTFSIGEFAVHLAHSLDLPAPRAGFTVESAAWALWHRGVRLRPDLNDPLTERDLISALQQIGFNLTASDPGRLVSQGKAETVLSTFVNGLAAERLHKRLGATVAAANGGDDFNNGNGKGGKFKRKGPKSPGSNDGG